MKKVFYLIAVIASTSCFAQPVIDDGFVTSRLNVRNSQPWITDFVEAFSKGINNAKDGKYSSVDDLVEKEKYDIRQQKTMEELVKEGTGVLSSRFLQDIIDIKSKVGGPYTTIPQIRTALKGLANEKLSSAESSFLAAFDISVQTIAVSYDMSSSMSDHSIIRKKDFLPRWLRCALGIIGGALSGGLAGAGQGSVVIPWLGTVAGGTIGVFAGIAAGATSYC